MAGWLLVIGIALIVGAPALVGLTSAAILAIVTGAIGTGVLMSLYEAVAFAACQLTGCCSLRAPPRAMSVLRLPTREMPMYAIPAGMFSIWRETLLALT